MGDFHDHRAKVEQMWEGVIYRGSDAWAQRGSQWALLTACREKGRQTWAVEEQTCPGVLSLPKPLRAPLSPAGSKQERYGSACHSSGGS